MKTLIMTAIVIMLVSSLNIESYAASVSYGNRPKVKSSAKRKKRKKSNARNINKCSKMGKREQHGILPPM